MNCNRPSNWYELPQRKTRRALKRVNSLEQQAYPQVSPVGTQTLTESECCQTLYESLPCIAFTLNSMGVIVSASRFAATYLGCEVAELTQKSATDVFYGQDQATFTEKLTQLQRQPMQISQWETRLVHHNGTLIWVKVQACWALNTQSIPVIHLVCEDISRYKQVEETLHLTDFSFESCSMAAVWLKRDASIWRVNEAACQMLGYSHEQLQSMHVYDIDPDFPAEAWPEHWQALKEQKIMTVVSRHRKKDGSIVPVELTLNYLEFNGEEYNFAFSRDISVSEAQRRHRQQTLEALQESEQRFRSMADTAPMLLWMSGTDGQCTFFNQRWLNFTGHTLNQELGNGWVQGVHPDDVHHCLDTYWSAFSAHKEFKMEYRLRRFDGEYRWVLDTGMPRFTSEGTFVGYIGSCIDITERKQTEEALQQQFLRERIIGAIAGRIYQSLNLDEILNTTVAQVRQVLECDRVIVFRIHADGSGVVVVESVADEWIPISGTIINDRYFAQDYIKLYQQGRVQAIEDIYTSGLTPCHTDLLAQFQVRANLVVPIVQEDKLWGLLVAQQCSHPRTWQPSEVDLLKALATHAAIAIQQSELYEQAQTEIAQRQQAEAILRQQFQRERLVGAISQRIRQSLNLEEILGSTVAEVRQVLQTDRVIIFQFEPDWSGNVVVESVGEGWPAIFGTHIYDPCFKEAYISPYREGRVRTIENIHTAELSQCHVNLLAQFQVQANLVVPILQSEQPISNSTAPTQHRLWGLLIAHHCAQPRQWQQFEIDLLCSLASQVAIAIQQSQLYEHAQSLFKREQALNQVTQTVRSSLDLNTIFSTATREVKKLLQVDRAQIVQYLPEQKRWVNVANSSDTINSSVSEGLAIPDENNAITERLKRLEVVQIEDTHNFENPLNQKAHPTVPGAGLLVPLHFGSTLWGALELVREIGPYSWQESEVELLCEVAAQLAIALQQAELYQQSRTATAQALTQAQQLEQALQELQQTQAQLVQSEKMSSLGQLVAGVAHEINNPVSFIYGNLIHAAGYTQDLLGLLGLYQQHYPNPISEIQSEIEAIELDYLMEDLPKLLDSMKVGAERICEIVSSLRNFSRFAEAEIKAVDIHEGLDSTLIILQNRLKAQGKRPAIEVVKQYGNLPKVECYAGQLNQVFMNLLTNAIDALEELLEKRSVEEIDANPNVIRVHTQLLNHNTVEIRIADNGIGMTEEVKQRVFDPFFTTKPVGAGTGLGLSISYQLIVEKHGGRLYCLSELGQGTEFVIQIPLCQGAKDLGRMALA